MDKKVIRGLIVGGLTLGALAAAYLIMKGKKGNKIDLNTGKVIIPPITTAPQEECITFPIGRGAGYTKVCERPAVRLIQTWINAQDWLLQTWVDGKFGADTEDLIYSWTGQKTVDRAFYEQIKRELTTTLSYEFTPLT